MNKFFLSLILFLGTVTVVSQNVFDALRYSNDEIEGSARYSAMSGAFGALGGELSAISINPAGSAIFSKGIASFTLSHFLITRPQMIQILLIIHSTMLWNQILILNLILT